VHRVVIAGAGFGGIATAVTLRRLMAPSEVEIVLVDRRAEFMMGLRKTWAILGIAPLEDGRRPLAKLRDIEFVRAEIERIDPAGHALTAGGREIRGDALVIALGARHALDTVPGLAEHGVNVWDAQQVDRAQAALTDLRQGRLAIGIFGMPYSCPPGPFELALLARDRLGPQVEVVVFGPAPMALPVVGAAESAKLERMLEDAGIEFQRQRQVVGVSRAEVAFSSGPPVGFDVLLAVPAHRCPQMLVDAGLAEPGGWVKPSAATLETEHLAVYALGDCTAITLANGLPLPKAGVIAAGQGEAVAARIAAALAGRAPEATYAGDAFCYVETGGGRATQVSGSFYAAPAPAVTISVPTAGQLDDKREFERSRLAAWFGR
jgi:sulfide:quinone oxidoreductase